MKSLILLLALPLAMTACATRPATADTTNTTDTVPVEIAPSAPSASFRIDPAGMTIGTRFLNLDTTYVRRPCPSGTYARFLLDLPLHPDGYPCHQYNDSLTYGDWYCGVIDMEIGRTNLQQCADAAIRLRAEYLYAQGRYDEIAFRFTNGWRCEYRRWAEGNRVHIQGNRTWWQLDAQPDYSYATFRHYLNKVFEYAGSYSLSRELRRTPLSEVKPGDLLIIGGTPGHVETVVDVLYARDGSSIRVMLAQSYMPAQEIEILRHDDEDGSPWKTLELWDDDYVFDIATPSYWFQSNNFYKWE